jgi:hypothetical protein
MLLNLTTWGLRTSRPKERVLRIFIAIKNPSPRPGLNPRPLCPVASTLTTSPKRFSAVVTWPAYKATLALRPLLTYRAAPSEFLSFLIHPPKLSGNNQQRHLVAKQEESARNGQANGMGQDARYLVKAEEFFFA